MLVVLISAQNVHAQSWLNNSWNQLQHAGGSTGAGYSEPIDPRLIVANIVKLVLTFVATILFVLIAYSGYKWMTAQGNDEKVGEAKKTIYNSTIGLVVILASYAITIAVTNLALGRDIGTGSSQGGATLDNAIRNGNWW